MGEIKEVKIDGVTHPLKDETARKDLENIKGCSIITAYPNEDITNTEGGLVQLPIRTYIQKGSKFTVSNNSIVVGSGVEYVEVSANAMMNCKSMANGARNLAIRLNGSEAALCMTSELAQTAAINSHLSIAPKLLKVKQGDVITFHWYTPAGDYISGINARTYITVKQIY